MTRVLFYPLLAAASLFLSATITNAAPQHLLSAQDIASMSGAAGPPASNLAGAGPTGIGASPAGASLGPTTSSSIPTAGSQVVPQQDVQVGSETDVVPTTGVFPNLVFQPAIQLFDPVVSNFQTYGSGIGSGAAPSVSSGTFSKRRDGCGSSAVPTGPLAFATNANSTP
ncbi:hypothetical protein EDD21DRAFT_438328 [Dissophora ornata]|nr:hypothetical protein EDD21DRAFT_438328 [Dissophora ornata]